MTSSQLVSIKFGERRLKLRLNMITERNLSMIFKLDISRGIYLTSEEEEEIVLADNAGDFNIEDPSKTYVVNGEENSSLSGSSRPSASNTSIALPMSYQSHQRSSTNPPPGGMRPTFTSRPKATRSPQWKKSFTVVDVKSNGSVTEKYQIHLSLQEDTADVEQIKQMLQDQLGQEVTIVDSKFLPIIVGTTTQGSKFWKSSRKVMVVKSSELPFLDHKRNNKRSKTDVLGQLRDFMESTSRDASQAQQPAVTSSKEDVKSKMKNIFKCTICLNTAELPAAACASCYHTIGCIACIEQWLESSQLPTAKCPLCRTAKPYNIIPMVRTIAELLGQAVPIPEQKPAGNTTESPQNTHQEDDDSDDADLFTSVFN